MDISIHKSAQFIAHNSEHVNINCEKIHEFCKTMFSSTKIPEVDFSHILHPNCSRDKDFIDWIFFIDSLNFCFWSDTPLKCWTVTYNQVQYSGYYALCAALKKAKDSGINIADPAVNTQLSLDTFKEIVRGDDGTLPKLVEERHKFLVDNSNILLNKYQGTFDSVVKKANRSACTLLSLIIEEFPSFRDESTFHGKKVSFYKRAQILVADLFFCATTTSVSDTAVIPCIFEDIHHLTMFADYRVPQVLKHFGILEYSSELLKSLEEPILQDPDGILETELRGNSIEAVERMVKVVNQMYQTNVSAITMDVFLWNYRREHVEELGREPYHRVISVFY